MQTYEQMLGARRPCAWIADAGDESSHLQISNFMIIIKFHFCYSYLLKCLIRRCASRNTYTYEIGYLNSFLQAYFAKFQKGTY